MGLWDEFRKYLIREKVVNDEEDAEAYMADYLGRDYSFDSLENELWHFADFLNEQFRKRYGDAEGLWFLVHVDYQDYEYNQIKVVKDARIGKYEYEVLVDVYDCRLGKVANSPEDFNKEVDRFLRETKERLDNLLQNIK